MKAVLISIQPKWCSMIASGEKTVEVRKTKPDLRPPFKAYIYETTGATDTPWIDEDGNMIFKGRGRVIGEFICDECSLLSKAHYGYIEQYGRVSKAELKEYMGLGEHRELEYSDGCYGWHISNLVIYDAPKGLGEFIKPCPEKLYCESCAMYRAFEDRCGNMALKIKKAPQSWCYVEEMEP